MTDRGPLIVFVAGCLSSALIAYRNGLYGLHALLVIAFFIAAGMYVLRRVAATDFQERLGRYGYAFAAGFLVGGILMPLLLALWNGANNA